jgi:hypothetical protein
VLQAERATGREDAVGRSRRRRLGDMPDVGAQAFVKRVALDVEGI